MWREERVVYNHPLIVVLHGGDKRSRESGWGSHRAAVFAGKYFRPVAAASSLSVGHQCAHESGHRARVDSGDVVVKNCICGFDDGHIHKVVPKGGDQACAVGGEGKAVGFRVAWYQSSVE